MKKEKVYKCVICKARRPVGEMYKPRIDKLQYVCSKAISLECTAKFGLKLARDQKKKEDLEYKRETKRIQEKYEDLPVLAEKLSLAHNAFTRKRDYDKNCISCDKPILKVWKNYHAGHFIPYGSKYKYSPLRFDERNNNGQCANCNTYRGGRQADYEAGLINRYGKAHVDAVKELKRKCDSGEVKALTKQEMKDMIVYYRNKLKALKAEL